MFDRCLLAVVCCVFVVAVCCCRMLPGVRSSLSLFFCVLPILWWAAVLFVVWLSGVIVRTVPLVVVCCLLCVVCCLLFVVCCLLVAVRCNCCWLVFVVC